MVVVVTLKSKMVVGEIVKVRDLEQGLKCNKSPEPLLGGPATSEQMPELLPFKFPALGNTTRYWIRL